MSAIKRNVTASKEIRDLIEELIWVFGLPEECVMVTGPDGKIKIENEKRDHILEIEVLENLYIKKAV